MAQGIDSVAKRRLSKYCSYVKISKEDGLRLMGKSSSQIIQSVEGVFGSSFYGYFFFLDGMLFYFESEKRVEVDRKISVHKSMVPK